MRVVIAPDKFKGSLSAPEVIRHLSAGLRAAGGEAGIPIEVIGVPVADGGEGTLDAAVAAGFERRSAVVTGPTGRPVEAEFAVRGADAVIEMAAASGLNLLPGGVPDPRGATSQGTGELIRAALDAGARHLTLAIGGSASTDGGAGMLRGLGAELLDSTGSPIANGGGALAELQTVDLSGVDSRLKDTSIVLASDVDNPLLGPNGAAAVFGPQKGASSFDIALLERALENFSTRVSEALGLDSADDARRPGSGAAGGVGYAALAVLGATRRAGVEIVLEFTGLLDVIPGADLVITGEGSLDEQSLAGKTPVGVARAAAAAGVPVVAVCGRTTLDPEALRPLGFERVYPLTAVAVDSEDAITRAGVLLEQIATDVLSGLSDSHLNSASPTPAPAVP